MALEAYAGVFTLNLGAGNQAIVAPGFTPKVTIFLSNAEDVSEVNTHYFFGIGAATGSGAQFLVHGNSENAVAPSDTSWIYRSTRCIGALDVGLATYDYYCTFVSNDANGFTVNVVNPPAFGVEVAYLCLGGADLSNVALGKFQKNAAVGNQAIAGLGFQPTAVFFAGHTNTYEADIEADVHINLGTMDEDGNQGCASVFSNNNGTPSNTARYQRSDCCYSMLWNGGLDSIFQYVSMDAGGFTWNQTVSGGTQEWVNYIALQVPRAHVGALNATGGVADIAIAGIGQQPEAGIFFSTGNTSAAGLSNHNELSVGLASDPTETIAMGGTDEDNQNPTDADRWMYPDSVDRDYDYAQALDGEMELKSWDWNGFTLTEVDAYPAANEIIYLVLGLPGTLVVTPTPADAAKDVVAPDVIHDYAPILVPADAAKDTVAPTVIITPAPGPPAPLGGFSDKYRVHLGMPDKGGCVAFPETPRVHLGPPDKGCVDFPDAPRVHHARGTPRWEPPDFP